MRVKITLEAHALKQALHMRELRGIKNYYDFEGPIFEKVVSYDPNYAGKFVWVSLEDGSQYYYPLTSVARIAAY